MNLSFMNLFLRLVLAVTIGAGLAGCPSRGTNEAEEFQMLPDYSVVSYSLLRSKLLQPMKCLQCHAEMNQESGMLQYLVPGQARLSRLFEVIERGEMPKGGPKLSDRYVKMLETYINGVPVSGPTPQPSPTPLPTPAPTPSPLKPTFASLEYNLVYVSCTGCHGVNQPSPGRRISLTDYETVKKNASEILTRISYPDSDPDVMPPSNSKRPKPQADVIHTFSAWINAGFPEN